LAFVVYLFFFDDHSMLRQRKLKAEENKLVAKRDFYLKEIEKDRQAKLELMSNPENLEKYAREHYLMKRDNEDVFVVVEKTED
jgi:cell division protein FtsB